MNDNTWCIYLPEQKSDPSEARETSGCPYAARPARPTCHRPSLGAVRAPGPSSAGCGVLFCFDLLTGADDGARRWDDRLAGWRAGGAHGCLVTVPEKNVSRAESCPSLVGFLLASGSRTERHMRAWQSRWQESTWIRNSILSLQRCH